MRKRRAIDLGTTKQKGKKGLDNPKGDQTKPDPCTISKTPNCKVSSTTTISRRNAGKSPKGRNDKQLPTNTPTRLNFSSSDALGRLRKTPQRLAAWRNLLPHDSSPEIIWDNDCSSPRSTFNQAKGREMFSSRSTQDQLTSLIREIAKTNNRRSLNKDETNFFQVWMKKDDGETSSDLMPSDKDCKKKRSILHRSDSREHQRSVIHRKCRKRSRITPCNFVKIKEELSSFIKDINEKVSTDIENVKDIVSDVAKEEAVKSEENRTEKAIETSAQTENLNGEIIIENQQSDLGIDDDALSDFDELPPEINESEDSGTYIMTEGKCLKGGQSQRMAGICDKIVDDKCEANGNVTKPDNEIKKGVPTINMSKTKQASSLREDYVIQKGSNAVNFENQVGKIHGKSFSDVPKSAPSDSQKCQAVNERTSPMTERSTQNDCVKSVTRCSPNETLADVEKKVNELNVEKMVVHNNRKKSGNLECKERLGSCVKELKAIPEFHENEFDELIMREDDCFFDEINDGDIDELKEDLSANDFDSYDCQNDLRMIENVENNTLKSLEIKHLKAFNDCEIDKDKRTVMRENCDKLLENEDDLDGIDFDDCADLIDQSCFNNFDLNQGSLVVSENAESFVENRVGTECLNETNRTVNRIDMNKPPMESELEGIKKSSSKQKDKTLDKDKYNDKRERTVGCGNDEYYNVRKKTTGLKFNVKREDLIVNTRNKTLSSSAEVKTIKANAECRRLKAGGKSFEVNTKCYLDLGNKVNDHLEEECLAENESSLSDFVHNFETGVHANKNEYNCVDNELVDVALDLEDWDDEIMLEGGGLTTDPKIGCELENAGKQDSWKIKKIMNNTNNKCGKVSKEAEELVKNTTGNSKELRIKKYDSCSIPALRSGKNRLHHYKNELINEQENMDVKSMPNHHKTEVPFRPADSIKYRNVKDRYSTAKEQGIITKNDKPKFDEFDMSSITDEETGNSVDLDDSKIWDDDPNPLEKLSAPFTSTQKIDLRNKASSGKTLQLCKAKTYNAEEIERKRIEAMERLKHRKLERRQLKMASSR